MNNARRKTIEEIKAEIATVQSELSEVQDWFKLHLDKEMDASVIAEHSIKGQALKARIEKLKDQLESPKEEEQDSLDNLPESLQRGEKGETMQSNVEAIERALDLLQEAVDALEEIN